MKKHINLAAFTLIELLVVISIIAILAGIALPVFSSVQTKGAQTKALSNAKQIGLALKLYATDNNGNFPSYTLTSGKPTTTTVQYSNYAFAQLFPDYLQSEQIFWLAKSKWCTTSPPDDKIDQSGTYPPVDTLKQGENEWAYVVGLSDTSNASWPLLADGFASEQDHSYVVDETAKGGVWKGKAAIVIRVDASGTVMKTHSTGGATTTYLWGPNGSSSGQDGDIFTTSNASTGWLGGTNTTVNPL